MIKSSAATERKGSFVSQVNVESLREVVQEDKLPLAVADMYLRLYVAEIDWAHQISVLYNRVSKQNVQDVNSFMRQVIACTILLRAYQPSVPLDPHSPESLLFSIHKFHQFQEKDWFAQLQSVIKRDIEIQDWRRQALSLGVVEKIEFQPYYRQAFNWLYGKAEDEGTTQKQNDLELVSARFRKLVQAYGGSVICNVFTRHPDAVKRVLNWRSGYFFERQIFRVYSIDQVMKIKKLELEKTNNKLVKKVSYAK